MVDHKDISSGELTPNPYNRNIQSNFNGSNTFGGMKTCSRQGSFELVSVNHSASQEAKYRYQPHRGDSNEYTKHTIFNIKKENHPKLAQICSYGIFFQGTQGRVRNSLAKRAISFRATEWNMNPLHIQQQKDGNLLNRTPAEISTMHGNMF